MTDRDPTDDPEEREDPVEVATHDVFAAVERLWELAPKMMAPQTADWLVLCANIAADKKYRARKQS